MFIYSDLTKEALAGFLMEEIFMGDTREDEVLGIFHDGKAVYWKLDLLIGD